MLPFTIAHEVRDRCVCLHAQRTARLLARRFDAAFRTLGVTSGQFSLLISIHRPEPPQLAAVAGLLGMDRTTLTANLKPLEQRRWITVSVDRADRRARRLALTRAGLTVVGKALPPFPRASPRSPRAV